MLDLDTFCKSYHLRNSIHLYVFLVHRGHEFCDYPMINNNVLFLALNFEY